ncbi:Type II restriction enzyme BsuBI [hydrothermal vent metagenome]|uniref:Type II restriction enzyme BsuBI n=1 Tax=hydrothermal vent metagenome TaxID=652676 RepID=A0A3B0YC00_9ZZZZ
MAQIHDMVAKLRAELVKQGKTPAPASYQGVTKKRITEALNEVDRFTEDQRDAVFALLDNERDSFYSLQYKSFPSGIKFCEGATVAHVGCHFGILQRNENKSDREGRDHWLKPLWLIGAIDKVFFDKNNNEFIPGHPVSNSNYTAYRLAQSFKVILTAEEGRWRNELKKWIKKDAIRTRLELQARLSEESRKRVNTKHSDLIKASCDHYAPHFLPGYEVLYIDDGDGDRVTEDEQKKLANAGIHLEPDDSKPDVLLWNPKTDHLWVIEAVTSDGEADIHKVNNLTALAKRSGKAGIGFTTTYQSWSVAASRQRKQKNLAAGTYLWIQEDASKHFLAEAFEVD